MGGNFPAGKREERDKRKEPLILNRVVIREGPGRTPGVGPSTGSGQRGEIPPRVRVGISRGRPVGPVHRGNDVIQNLLKLF